MNIETKCPYCQNILEKMPTRKKMCPHCQKFIFVRDGKPVTEEGVEKIDKYRIALDKMREFNILERSYQAQKEKLIQKFGHEPKSFDIIWSIANEQILKIKDPEALSDLYLKMAHLLNEEKKDSAHILQLSKKFQLQALKKQGHKKIKISPSYYSCPMCLENKDKILTIEEAFKSMPIPNENCTHILNDPNQGFCECRYEPLYEFDEEELKIEISPKTKKSLLDKDTKKIGCILLIAIITIFILIAILT